MSEKNEQVYVTMKQWNALLKEVQGLRVMFNYQTNPPVQGWQFTNRTQESPVLQDVYFQILKLEQEIYVLKQLMLNMSEI